MTQSNDLGTLHLELQRLDRVPRMGYLLRGVADCESVAEHTFHLAFLVWTLGMECNDLDVSKAVELALLHDLAEVRIGDIPRTAARYLPEGAKKTAERNIQRDLLAPLGQRAASLIDEYAERKSREARFVRVCDQLQLLIKVASYRQAGATGLEDLWALRERFDDGGFEPARRVLAEVVRASSVSE